MRSLIIIAAIASLAAGASFAQYDAKPAVPPAAQSKPATPPSAKTPTTPDTKGAALTEVQAKSRFEAQGYTNVSELKREADGMWHARAMKDGRSVQVSLDTQGQIRQLN